VGLQLLQCRGRALRAPRCGVEVFVQGIDGRGDIGARLNIVETTQTDNEDVVLVNKSVQAQLRELDYAEALSRLSFQSIVLEAAQQSYVKIAGLSLFNPL